MRGERRLISGTNRTNLFLAPWRAFLMLVRCTGVPRGPHECHPSQTWRWSTSASNPLMFPLHPALYSPSSLIPTFWMTIQHQHLHSYWWGAQTEETAQALSPCREAIPRAASDLWNRRLWRKCQWWTVAVPWCSQVGYSSRISKSELLVPGLDLLPG